MHTPSMVKVRWWLLKLSSGNEIQTDGRTYDWRMDRNTDAQRETIIPRHYRVAGYNYMLKMLLLKLLKIREVTKYIFLWFLLKYSLGYSSEAYLPSNKIYISLISSQKYSLWVHIISVSIDGVTKYIFLWFLLKNIRCGYSLEAYLLSNKVYISLISPKKYSLWVLIINVSAE